VTPEELHALDAAKLELENLRVAARTLMEFARTAPGRLPERIEVACAVVALASAVPPPVCGACEGHQVVPPGHACPACTGHTCRVHHPAAPPPPPPAHGPEIEVDRYFGRDGWHPEMEFADAAIRNRRGWELVSHAAIPASPAGNLAWNYWISAVWRRPARRA
jgi:hypothetical protein